MKLGFALLAAGAVALNVMEDAEYGEWGWDDCLEGWMQVDWTTDDCGWWWSPELDDDWEDDEWVTCEEWDEADEVCDWDTEDLEDLA